MAQINKILVPVDFSSCSQNALECAAYFAGCFEAELQVLHVWESPPYVDGATRVRVSGKKQSLSEYARTTMDKEMQRFIDQVALPKALNVTTNVKIGDPCTTVVTTAEQGGYDVIIMGTHGRTGLSHLMLGSIAEKVLRRAPCPVLTVRQRRNKTKKSYADKIEKIIVPVDFSRYSKNALDYAVALGQGLCATVDLLHVLELPKPSFPEIMVEGPGQKTQPLSSYAKNEAQKELKALVASITTSGFSPKSQLTTGEPLEQILAAAHSLDYDLIVMGTHGCTGLKHLVLGSVSEKVLRRAPCPVLIIPAEGEAKSDD